LRKDEDFKRSGDGIVFALQKLIMKCWNSNPTERYTFKDLAKKLKVFANHSLNHSSTSYLTIPPSPPPPPIPLIPPIIDNKIAADKAKVSKLLSCLHYFH
jgi:hypothetical protein